ncbi:MAG: hypothetical protein Q9186_002178 [Xanthomendoza sp. 1 TL-2023]
MRLTASLPLILATSLHAVTLLAQPVSARETATSNISPLGVDGLQSSSSLSTRSPLSNPPFNVKGFNRYIYPVENTNIVLKIKLGPRLDHGSLAFLLDTTQDVVVRAISRFGGDTGLPMNLFEWDNGEDSEFVAESSQALNHRLTWAVTKDAITGLQQFLVDQRRYRAASCRVNRADGDKAFLGYVDVRRRRTPRRTEAVRSLPNLPLSNDKNL